MNSRPIIAVFAVLASLAPCSALAACPPGTPYPIEQSIVPFSVVRPNGGVIITGLNFGATPGELRIHVTDFTGRGLDYPLDHLVWGDTFAAGVIQNIQSVLGQNVTFELINACGTSSKISGPPLQAFFTPTMDVSAIPGTVVSCVKTSLNSGDSCQHDPPANIPGECNIGGLGIYGTGPPGVQGPYAYWADHHSGWGNGNQGTDNFSATLAHTWTVQSVKPFGWTATAEDGSWDTQNTINSRGPKTWARVSYSGSGNKWSVEWSENGCTDVSYLGIVMATGPMGVPFQ
jgi:hypothetical protein